MSRRQSLIILASVASLTSASTVVWAVSPSQAQCEAGGGTFTRSGGEVQCLEEGKNPKFTETTTGRGNINNKQETECGGTGSNKCPPGQF